MPDDAPPPHHPAPPPCSRVVTARYLDLRTRGLTHEAALGEATALLWALLPSLSPRQAGEMAEAIVGSAAG